MESWIASPENHPTDALTAEVRNASIEELHVALKRTAETHRHYLLIRDELDRKEQQSVNKQMMDTSNQQLKLACKTNHLAMTTLIVTTLTLLISILTWLF
jgi:hypothetical protein